MKKLLLPLFLLVFLAGCGGSPAEQPAGEPNEDGFTVITAEEAKTMLDSSNKVILVDVRTEDEYAEERIDGAVLIPHNEISSRAEAELPKKDATIIVYCASGVRALEAAKILADLGYTNVYTMGGILSWPYDTVTE